MSSKRNITAKTINDGWAEPKLKRIWNKNPNMLVPYYLMFSYLYYKDNTSLIDDTEYDLLCKTLLEKFDEVEHIHKHRIDKSSLTAGTGYDIMYNNRIVSAALKLKEEWKNA